MGDLDLSNINLSDRAPRAQTDFVTQAWEVGLPSEQSLMAGREAAIRDASSFPDTYRAHVAAAIISVGSALKAGTQRTFAPDPGASKPGAPEPRGSDPFSELAPPPRRIPS